MADSDRWTRFPMRPDDVVSTTPSKSGTTWMQAIVGMLLLDRVPLDVPISTVSPWLDMLTRSEDEVFGTLAAQRHRRFIKTHTPLDGLPRHDSVTYLALVRHPLDVALSDRDHAANMRDERALELKQAAAGAPQEPSWRAPRPTGAAEYLRWFIDNDEPPRGSGPDGLADFCNQARTYWQARDEPNVHLFHYADLWADREDEMRRVAAALGVHVDRGRWPALVEAASLNAMRSRAGDAAPEADVGLWRSPEGFFRTGGTREWATLMSDDDVRHFQARLAALAGDAADWVLRGRGALGPG